MFTVGVLGAVPTALAATYTVKAGDTLYKVARTYNLDPTELMKLNKLNSSTLQVGQVLKVGDAAPTSTPSTVSTPAPTATRTSDRTGVVRSAAFRFLGIPYRLGATGRGAIDCSAFTRAVMEQMGIRLPRTTREQFAVGTPIARGNLMPGDLVFFNTLGNGVSHVGIYLGGGQFAHANSYKGRSVVEDMNSVYYRFRYIGARRVLPSS